MTDSSRDNGPNPADFAANVRALLTADWRNYRAFGIYWYFVKALLKRFFDRHEMPMLGDYVDQTVIDRMPEGLSAREYIAAAAAEFEDNARTRMFSNQVEDDDGETLTLIDPDMPG